jgi:hypothetical protein
MDLEEFNATFGASEETVHKQLVTFLDQSGEDTALLFHPANGGLMPMGTAGKLKGMGMRQGVPDLFLAVPAAEKNGLFVELKTQEGRLRGKQVWWLYHLREEGYGALCCRGFEDAAERITAYLGGDYQEHALPTGRIETPDHV